jgi:ribosome biogenesis protein BRX1
MASVYKSLSKTNGHKEEETVNGVKKNKQRVLILSSRGITYRSVFQALKAFEQRFGSMN